MAEGAQEGTKVEEKNTHAIFREMRNEISENIGRTDILTKLDQLDPSQLADALSGLALWIKGSYQYIQQIIEITHGHEFRLETVEEAVKKLDKKIDDENNKLAIVLNALEKWRKEYQPTLDEAKKDYEDKERRVSRI